MSGCRAARCVHIPGMCSRMVARYPSYQSEDVYQDNNGKKLQQKNVRTEVARRAVSAHD